VVSLPRFRFVPKPGRRAAHAYQSGQTSRPRARAGDEAPAPVACRRALCEFPLLLVALVLPVPGPLSAALQTGRCPDRQSGGKLGVERPRIWARTDAAGRELPVVARRPDRRSLGRPRPHPDRRARTRAQASPCPTA